MSILTLEVGGQFLIKDKTYLELEKIEAGQYHIESQKHGETIQKLNLIYHSVCVYGWLLSRVEFLTIVRLDGVDQGFRGNSFHRAIEATSPTILFS